MKAGLIQLTSGDDPVANLPVTQGLIEEAAGKGATLIVTPEVTNCVSQSRTHQQTVLTTEDQDETLRALRVQAQALGVYIVIGSLALKTSESDGRFANRSFLISTDGRIVARYDKIHMFDVEVSKTETYRESDGYRPGTRAVVGDVGPLRLGMTICYDLRFPALFRRLAQAGAEIITVPSAFSTVTGAAHWQVLLRSRAIETGCYVLAPAQTGVHHTSTGRARRTYGHSLAIAPWGEILADCGTEPGIAIVDIDPAEVEDARRRVPSVVHDREFTGPE